MILKYKYDICFFFKEQISSNIWGICFTYFVILTYASFAVANNNVIFHS